MTTKWDNCEKSAMKCILAVLLITCVLDHYGFSQTPDASGGPEHLVLAADVAKASRKDDGRVVIPFSLKNNSDHEVTLHFGAWSGNIDGLAVVNPAGKITFIENIGLKRPQTYGKSGPIVSYTLKPGESVSDTYSEYSTEILAKVDRPQFFGPPLESVWTMVKCLRLSSHLKS